MCQRDDAGLGRSSRVPWVVCYPAEPPGNPDGNDHDAYCTLFGSDWRSLGGHSAVALLIGVGAGYAVARWARPGRRWISIVTGIVVGTVAFLWLTYAFPAYEMY